MKKGLASLLAGLMLLPLVSCANGDLYETASTDETARETETRDPQYVCDLPAELNFADAEVSILYSDEDGPGDEMYSEKLGLGGLSDAVYERNVSVENQLGVKLTMIPFANAADTAANLVTSGDASIEIFCLPGYQGVPNAFSGYYLDLNQTLYTDTSKQYWSQDFNDMMTMTDQKLQFMATSSAALTLFRLSYLTIFHKDLMNDRQLPNLYDAVKNGDWTLDFQCRIAANAYEDEDGDGSKSSEDFFGLVSGNRISLDGYLVASNIRLLKRDEAGDLYYNSGEMEKMMTMAEKVSALFNCGGTLCYSGFSQDNIGVYKIIEKFAKEQALMATTQFLSIERRISELADIPYGIVPMPKLMKAQETYHTYVQDRVTCFAISAAVKTEERRDLTSAIMESIAYNSYLIVRPAYYDISLSYRFMQDPESQAILDLMFESVTFDLVPLMGVGGVRNDLRDILYVSNPPIASRTRTWAAIINKEIKNLNASLDKLALREQS